MRIKCITCDLKKGISILNYVLKWIHFSMRQWWTFRPEAVEYVGEHSQQTSV